MSLNYALYRVIIPISAIRGKSYLKKIRGKNIPTIPLVNKQFF